MKIGIPGASLDTGNYGVNALAEGSIKCLLQKWPEAEFVFLASGRTYKVSVLSIGQKEYDIPNLPIRFCRNVFLKNHYLVLLLNGLFLRLVKSRQLKMLAAKRNPFIKEILSLDRVADITGGDSFTDLYGTRRFIQGGLVKYLWLLYGKPVYFLPQTYGPFGRQWVKRSARYLLAKASAILCRDQSGYEAVRGMFRAKPAVQERITLVPDVAFVLDAHPVKDGLTDFIEERRREGMTVAGLNISGLLYHGGYTRDNMFSLKADYQSLAAALAGALIERNCAVVFVPHVFPSSAVYHVESDLDACRKTAESALKRYPEARLMVADGGYTHNIIKYIIGQCDFFVGSRMHSCIAALSQCVPTVGIAYSDKFKGVFESVHQEQHVFDAKSSGVEEIVQRVGEVFANRHTQRQALELEIPCVQQRIQEQFKNLPDVPK